MELKNVTTQSDLKDLLEDPYIVSTLQKADLLPTEKRCERKHCNNRFMNLIKSQRHMMNMAFHCPRCKRKVPLAQGTFFNRFKVPPRMVLVTLFHWCNRICAHSLKDMGCISKNTVTELFKYFREICSRALLSHPHQKLGGSNLEAGIVQVDVSVMVKMKFESVEDIEEQWLLGIYDTRRKIGHIQCVPDRKAKTLTSIIKNHVAPGSIIYTDESSSYNRLSRMGYRHFTTCHKRHFKNLDTEISTNAIEKYWSQCKNFIRKLGVTRSPYLPEYIDQFTYLERNKGTKLFRRMLEDIASLYPVDHTIMTR